MDALARRFWWQPKKKEGSFIAWKEWDKLSRPKCVGGLGFKKTKEMNDALLAKFAWMVVSGNQSICMEVLRSKYKVSDDWLRADLSKYASPTWRAIERAKLLIEKGACFLLGDGKTINVWEDPWVPWIVGFKPRPRIDDYLQLPIKAHNLLDHTLQAWNEDIVREIFVAEAATAILSIPIPHSPRQDKLIWLPDAKGIFSVKSVNRVAFSHDSNGNQDLSHWKTLWKARMSEHVKMLLWRIGANAIPTRENLQRRMQHIDPSCIWKARNLQLFNQEQAKLSKACLNVQARFQDLSKVFSLTFLSASTVGPSIWSPPPPDHIKINMDAALDSTKSALAVVARNHLGKVLFLWGKVHHLCSPMIAEASALLWAIQLAS